MFLIKLINSSRTIMYRLLLKLSRTKVDLKLYATLISTILIVSGCQSTSPNKLSPRPQSVDQIAQFPNSKQAIQYDNAVEYLKVKDYSSAEVLLTELAEELPGFSGSWVNLGLIKLMAKQPSDAKTFVSRALKLAPKHPQALNLMGLIATHDRDIKLAESYYLQAIENSKQYANAHYNLALLYDIYLQDIRRAVKHYQSYLQHIQIEDKQTQDWVEQLQSSLTN